MINVVGGAGSMAEQSGHMTVEVGVLTVSDRVSRGEAEDLSGPLAISIIEQHLKHAKVPCSACIDLYTK